MGCSGAKSPVADESLEANKPWVAIEGLREAENSKRLFEFTEREEAEVFSFSKDRWFPCVVKAVYLANTFENGITVPRNTIKVEFVGGSKYIKGDAVEAVLRKKGSASPAPCRSPTSAATDGRQERKSLQGFSEGECVEMWSHRDGGWISCNIKVVYWRDTLVEDYIVPENTIKVESRHGVKYVRYADIPFALRHPAAAQPIMDATQPVFGRTFFSPCRSPTAGVPDLLPTEAEIEAIPLAAPPSVPLSEVIDLASPVHRHGSSSPLHSTQSSLAWQPPPDADSLLGQPVWCDPQQHSSRKAHLASKPVSSGQSRAASRNDKQVSPGELVEIDFCNPNWFKDYREKLKSTGIGDGASNNSRGSSHAMEPIQDSGHRLRGSVGSSASIIAGRHAASPVTGRQSSQDGWRSSCISPRSSAGGFSGRQLQHASSAAAKLKMAAEDKKSRARPAAGGRSGNLVIASKNARAAPKVAYAWGGADHADNPP